MSAGQQVMCAKCLDVIQSLHVHDMVWCKCRAIAIDGGDSYSRCLGNPEDFMWDFEEKND